MTAVKTQNMESMLAFLEDQIDYQMAECSITEVAKQLQFCATEAHQSEKTKTYTKLLKAYLIARLEAL